MKKVVPVLLIVALHFLPAPDADGITDASCHVSVHINPHASTVIIKGQVLARQNPDGTYYPGDAFDFDILVSWTRTCWTVQPQRVISGGLGIDRIQTGPTTVDADGGHYHEYGHAEIGLGTSGAFLSQTVGAYGLVCGISGCTRGHVSSSDSYAPQIIQPKVTISLAIENLTDRDGYEMRNMDGTYYSWDGINILYEPHYQWKQERFGTIDAVTDSSSDLFLAAKFECHDSGCSHTFSSGAVTPWSHGFAYEGGNTVYNATSTGDAGRHDFLYNTVVYNMGQKIGEGHNQTSALVVQYNPVYMNYPYAMLKETGSWWGFGKSPAVALHYLGSVGGGPDDSAGMHQDRRSKINSYAYSSFAYEGLDPVALDQPMTWSGAYPASFSDGNHTYSDDSLQPGRDSAMFVHAGYGKIVFSHHILYTILQTRHDNSTIIGTLQSENFAGYYKYNLTGYAFGYPHTKFSTSVVVVSLHSDGSINHIPIRIEMVPDYSDNATYEQDFIQGKVAHDRDRVFAGIVLGDMYGKQDAASGSGIVNMRANLTSMVLPDIYKVVSQNPLDIPLNLVYEQPSPYNVTITAGQKRVSFLERGFEFDTNWRYVVNTDQDNRLNATRYQNLVRIYPDDVFGPYSQVAVDGREQNVSCTGGCTLLLHDSSSNMTVTAYNIWGGKTSSTFGPYYIHAAVNAYSYGGVFASVLLMVAGLVGYGLARRYLKAL